jgi:hypothetical protein
MSRGPHATAHPYPHRLALSTAEILQGTLFFFTVEDGASARLFQIPAEVEALEREFEAAAPGVWEQGWGIVAKHDEAFGNLVIRNGLVAITSEWDWYVRKMAAFVEFARAPDSAPAPMSSAQRKDFRRIGFLAVGQQIDSLGHAAGVDFDISADTRDSLAELSLVRNLGVHNRWEVDEAYLSHSATDAFKLGETRLFDGVELQQWRDDLMEAVGSITARLGSRFNKAPEFSDQQAHR